MEIHPQLILDALRRVRYPATGKNLVEAAMVDRPIRIEGKRVSLTLVFDKPHDPFRTSVVRAAETAILTYVGKDLEVKGRIETRVREVPSAAETRPEASLLPGVKHLLAISSCKGGVGKSTVSANLAVALAALGYRVGLLDADLFGPSQPGMFQLQEARPQMVTVQGRERIAPEEKYGVKLLSLGFFVDKDKAVLWRGAMVGNALKQLITEAHWGELDYFLVDLPPGTGDVHLTLVQTLALTGALVVTTPQEVALADARKGVSMFTASKVNVPVLGLIENMAWFTPPELPHNRYYLFGKDGGRRLAEELGVPLLGQIPLVQAIREGADQGLPSALDAHHPAGAAFRELAREVTKQVRLRNEQRPPTERVLIHKV
ncbi:MAG: Mrp/NBP35 family ATP-binding protein [Tannerellaceae bacterium]|jgi:ATP-binding protein involved in chromosome partitioning|nr:Mrp/NBP35 family ATP-binding protein [Tannerellaceae bacterium]